MKFSCFEAEFGATSVFGEGSFHWDLFGYCNDLSNIRMDEDPGDCDSIFIARTNILEV